MSGIELKEVQKDDALQASIAHLSTIFNLANNMDLSGFIYCSMKFQGLVTNLQSMILCSIHGEKEIYYKVKKSVEDGLKDFIQIHDEEVEECYKEKTKGKH